MVTGRSSRLEGTFPRAIASADEMMEMMSGRRRSTGSAEQRRIICSMVSEYKHTCVCACVCVCVCVCVRVCVCV